MLPSYEDDPRISVGVQNRGRVSYRDITGRLGSRQVKVLVDGVQGDRESCTGSPLKFHLLSGEVFDSGFSVPGQDHDGLFE